MQPHDLTTVTDAIQRLIDAAYEAGRQDAIQSILASAQQTARPFQAGAETPIMSPPPAEKKVDVADGDANAPRGLARRLISAAMRERPGQNIAAYTRIVRGKDPRIAPRTIGNEIRRGEGKFYKRDHLSGHKWYLIDQEVPPEPSLIAVQFKPGN